MIVKLKNVRLSFFDGFVAKPYKPGDPARYGSTFLIAKNDPQIQIIEDAILQAATKKLGVKAKNAITSLRGNSNKFCFQDGDLKERSEYHGMMILAAHSKRRPKIVDRDNTPLTIDDGRPYSGCYVIGSVEIFAYNNSGFGISADLRGVQFYKDGDAFSGGSPITDDEFDSVTDFGDENAADAPLY